MKRWLRLILFGSALHLAVSTALILLGIIQASTPRAGELKAPDRLTQISQIWNAPYFYLWSPSLEKAYPKPPERALRTPLNSDPKEYWNEVSRHRWRHRIYPIAIVLLRATGIIVSTLLGGALLGALYHLATQVRSTRTA